MRIAPNCSIIFTVKQLAIYGMSAGLLIASMRFVEYRLLIEDRSVAVYGTVVATAFALAGLVLGYRLTKKEVIVREVPVEVPAPAVFEADQGRIDALGITPRELEVLQLIADGLSNREMAERLFVSEN